MYFILDNYDSFVYNIYAYFQEIGVEVQIKRIDEVDLQYIIDLNPKGIIISPGPGHPKDATLSLKAIDYFKEIKPILGVCLGHQAIGYYFGAKIEKGKKPIHGKIYKINHSEENIFKDIKNNINVTRYHSLIVNKDSVKNNFNINAISSDDVLMAMSHKQYPIYSVQFHPEAALTEYGHQMLKNFVNICERWYAKND